MSTFVFNSVSNEDMGVVLQGSADIGSADPVEDIYTVRGRNGNFRFFSGAYANRSISIPCYFLGNEASNSFASICSWLLYPKEYKRLEMSDDPDHFFMARCTSAGSYNIRADVLIPFTISFDCMPQKWLKSGELEDEVESSGTTFVNPTSFESKPLIRIVNGSTSGSTTISVAGTSISISLSPLQEAFIDCDTMNAYSDGENLNPAIVLDDGLFPSMPPGESSVSFSGEASNVYVTPKWWEV